MEDLLRIAVMVEVVGEEEMASNPTKITCHQMKNTF
jgi:hypothetical protein